MVADLLQRAIDDANGRAVEPRRLIIPGEKCEWRAVRSALASRASKESDGIDVKSREERWYD